MLDMNPQETYTAPEEVNSSSHQIDENALLQRHQVMVKRVVNQL
ncbi:FliA/WhiG family RNA polymerase sigma factor, partial [Vibrio parahaemolyticus]